MHEREGARLGISYRYVLIDFDELQLPDSALGEIVDAAQRLGFAGLNVTHPFKQSVTALLTRLADDAAVIGAVNTVVFAEGERVGYNTDSGGFAESFSESMTGCSLQNVLQLGAGGAGMAVAHALFKLGAEKVTVFDTDEVRSRHLAATLRDRMGKRVEVTPSPAAAIAQAGGHRQHDADRNGEVSWNAGPRRSALAASVGRRDHLFPAPKPNSSNARERLDAGR